MDRYDVIGLGYCSDDYLGIVPHITPFDGDTVTMLDFAHDGGGPVSTTPRRAVIPCRPCAQ